MVICFEGVGYQTIMVIYPMSQKTSIQRKFNGVDENSWTEAAVKSQRWEYTPMNNRKG